MELVNGTVVSASQSTYGGYAVIIHLDNPDMLNCLTTGQHVGIIDILEDEK